MHRKLVRSIYFDMIGVPVVEDYRNTKPIKWVQQTDICLSFYEYCEARILKR